MKFNKDQIKDLLYLKQKGCDGRLCFNCQWGRYKQQPPVNTNVGFEVNQNVKN